MFRASFHLIVQMKTFVDVLLPLPLSDTFTYCLKEEEENRCAVTFGCRVVVPFGAKKYYTAIVVNVHHVQPQGFEVKYVSSVLSSQPIVLPTQIALWQWIATYYLCSLGEIYKAALPSGLRIESETTVTLSENGWEFVSLSENEQQIVSALRKTAGNISVATLSKQIAVKRILFHLQQLVEKRVVVVTEKLEEGYSQKTESVVRLHPDYCNQSAIKMLREQLKRAQLKAFEAYLNLVKSQSADTAPQIVTWNRWQQEAQVSLSVLKTLLDKAIFVKEQRTISRLEAGNDSNLNVHTLSDAQQETFRQIVSAFTEKEVVLLHGVTSSGKTEIYIHLIRQTIETGKQVLFLLPEIALTTQITQRLRWAFGQKLGVYHSKFSDNERAEIWNRMLTNKAFDVIVGVRSSVFLPFSRLGLIIVDEEHENTYKQYDPAPRYHARNVAIMLAHRLSAKVLLGTATPSLESYYNARIGKYGLVELMQRHNQIALPEIIAVDMQEQRRKKLVKGPFSRPLYDTMLEALANKEQIILFQNRRGFAPVVECAACAWVPKCKHCDVSLTYHKESRELVCHYCGAVYRQPTICPSCGGTLFNYVGLGTERIEEEVNYFFPSASVARMDLDTTRRKNAHTRLLKRFESKEIDIMIGTQMLAKGLDFDNVTVVAILNADAMMNYPDFRSFERSFQMMTQVAGRAGRKGKRGKVFIQTCNPTHPIIEEVKQNDFKTMYLQEMQERVAFHYPPLYRMVVIYLKHAQKEKLDRAALTMAHYLRERLGDRVLGPDQPPIGRVQNLYIQKILLKFELSASYEKIAAFLSATWEKNKRNPLFTSVQLYFDVDPL